VTALLCDQPRFNRQLKPIMLVLCGLVRRPLRPFWRPFWLRFTYVTPVLVKKY
jgi:hypothetical protein